MIFTTIIIISVIYNNCKPNIPDNGEFFVTLDSFHNGQVFLLLACIDIHTWVVKVNKLVVKISKLVFKIIKIVVKLNKLVVKIYKLVVKIYKFVVKIN